MLLETQKFEFDDFLLDAREKILLRAGKPLPVTPKAFELLVVLLKNHGRLVEKNALLQAVWTDSFVEEANLAFTVGLLRKALGDNAQKPRFIETVPKRGYRFIAEVTATENGGLSPDRSASAEELPKPVASENPVAPAIDAPQPIGTRILKTAVTNTPAEPNAEAAPEKTVKTAIGGDLKPNRKLFALGAVLISLAGFAAAGFYFFSPAKPPPDGKKSIAVLPLKPISTQFRDELYEIGIADSLIHRLSFVKNLTVRPLSAVRRYADIEQDPIDAGREQRADYVLASNYQLSDGKIRVTAQLFKVADGQLEAAYQFEKDAGNVFAVQDAIAGEVGNILLAHLAANETGSRAKRGTVNEEAYRLYLQGMYLCDKRDLRAAQKAVEVLEQAVRLDPNYAVAWAGKAYAHRIIGNFGRRADAGEEYRKSTEAINKALSLDQNLPEAYSAQCDNKMYYEYDFAGAENACRRAVELAPDSSLAHQVYSRYLNSRGRGEEALREIKIAIDLDPTSFHNQRNLGVSLYFARRFEEAAAQFKRVIAMDENYPSTYMWLNLALQMQGDETETFEWFMKTPTVRNADQKTISAFRAAFETEGWKGVLRERVKDFENSTEVYFQGAAHHARLGNKNRAFEYLEKSFERRELWMANLRVDPRLDALRDDPRFEDLVRRVESK